MAQFIRGQVVVVPFPFSNLTDRKRRPALVLIDLNGATVVLCQITSKAGPPEYAIRVSENDFQTGSLHLESYVRPDRLFTFEKELIISLCGSLKPQKTNEVVSRLISLLGR